MRNDKDNLIVDLTFKFALTIIDYCEKLEKDKKYVLARQLLKSGTSIGANVREAQNAESKVDFIHKFKIAAKEVDEAEYWLLLCKKSEHYPDPDKILENYKASFVSSPKSLVHLNHNFQILKSSNFQMNYVR